MPDTLIEDKTETTNILGTPHNVILFNDSVHSFDEVIMQIMRAIKCSAGKAGEIAMKAHSSGEAVVFCGSLERCEHIDSILAGPPASLRTSIQPA